MSRIHVEKILAPLKPFQQRTVNHAFDRLFTAPDSTQRFLVADEVGLGKTLVARGVIARTLDYLWDKNKRIDIIYICSNQNIARFNLPKLDVTGEQEDSQKRATRLTMLATELAAGDSRTPLAEGQVNFVSFTPGTSFNMGESCGRWEERRILFYLLADMIKYRTAFKNLLQGDMNKENWREKLNKKPLLEPGIQKRFQESVQQETSLITSLEHALQQWFMRARRDYPEEARQERNRLIRTLRYRLAEVCIAALQPDLVILDEFQRFKELVNQDQSDQNPASRLARKFLATRNASGHPVRTLLLSATPYKLYTPDAEIQEENHYQDFLATTKFLLDFDEKAVSALQGQLKCFSRELKRAANGQDHDAISARQEVESSLRRIMARTERVTVTEDHDAMVEEPRLEHELQPEDIRQYLAADAWFSAAGAQEPVTFWKSGPYLPHFMHGYRVNELVRREKEQRPERLLEAIGKYPDAFLDQEALSGWGQLSSNHPKLRRMVQELLDTGLWKLLWMPPSLPYWPLSGPFQGQEESTKTLVFSAWNFVPEVVSAVLSYEAERRMMGGMLKHYQDPEKQRSRLLRLTDQGGTLSRHRLLLLLMPCVVLADYVHPLAAPPEMDMRDWAKSRIETLLEEIDYQSEENVEEDPRWEYMAPVLLDPGLRDFLSYWLRASEQDTGKPHPEVLPGYLQQMLNLDPSELGRQPKGLADLLTDVALGSPGIIAARTLAAAGLEEQERRARATQLAHAFWKLFNRPAVICLLQQIYDRGSAGEENIYWRRVLRYCMDGNLQAVMDEAWHLYWEQHAWSDKDSSSEIACSCVQKIAKNIEPRASRVHVQFFGQDGKGALQEDELRIRTVLAQRFGNLRTEEGEVSQDEVRAAFNSPFRPFILTSTSIGQEGLDFHPWCHRLMHWNLPGNPVDLEQREGRVHRYKGHAIRRNVARQFGGEAVRFWNLGNDLWETIFGLAENAARERGAGDLVPCWMAQGPYKIQRCVAALPYTREVEAYKRLKRQLAAYRVVFGQPRQEELLMLLDQARVPWERLQEWTIRLAP